MGESLNKTLTGVIGWPISHSLSPTIHTHWMQQNGINGYYSPLAVHPKKLSSTISRLQDLGYVGINVTVPHKESILDVIDECDDNALRLGAVNTLVIKDGIIIGKNTDGHGFLNNIKDTFPNHKLNSSKVTLLGAGGAARAISYTLVDQGVSEIRIVNRSKSRAETFAATFGGSIRVFPWEERAEVLEGTDILINATTLGMDDKDSLDLPLVNLPTDALIIDIVYRPLMTPLLREAEARGNPFLDGLGMLIHQASKSFECWHDKKPAIDNRLRELVLREL